MFYSSINPNRIDLLVHKKNFVDNSFICRVEKYIKTQHLEKAKFWHMGKDTVVSGIRNSRIHWMTDERYKDDLAVIYQELVNKILFINDGNWGWIINGWEPFQYSEYDESYKGHYGWHIDFGMKEPMRPDTRKLSFSLGISNKDDYEGGELIVKTCEKEQSVKLDRGEISIFPSWVLHKVTPVTKGKRRVIVGWGLGPVV